MSTVAEFSRMIDARAIDGREIELVASTEECTALARRFALTRIDSLTAHVRLERGKDCVLAEGRFAAAVIQPCAVSGEDMAVALAEPFTLRFIAEGPGRQAGDDIEITAEDCDEIYYAGTQFDLGEAVAQSLGLAIDPFATGPAADRVRAEGLVNEGGGAFAALAALKKP